MRIPFDKLYGELLRVLLGAGFPEERARLSARLFAEASRDGVYSHGLNRFPSYMEAIKNGHIDIQGTPVKVEGLGGLERWDGRRGPGNLNAWFAMDRAVSLARQHGLGCVALKNTNHWMRAGSYGLQAAEAGCIGICWTNTMPNMPPWGAKERKIGNNPIVFAIPREMGPIVLDMAMSQFSYGQLGTYKSRGDSLPVPGGFDEAGQLSSEPGDILQTGRMLPIGYWKGSGLSIVLDLIATVLSGGRSTYDIGQDEGEQAISQVFIAIDAGGLSGHTVWKDKLEMILQDLHEAAPAAEQGDIRYPGEDMLRRRAANLRDGVPVEESVWRKVLDM